MKTVSLNNSKSLYKRKVLKEKIKSEGALYILPLVGINLLMITLQMKIKKSILN